MNEISPPITVMKKLIRTVGYKNLQDLAEGKGTTIFAAEVSEGFKHVEDDATPLSTDAEKTERSNDIALATMEQRGHSMENLKQHLDRFKAIKTDPMKRTREVLKRFYQNVKDCAAEIQTKDGWETVQVDPGAKAPEVAIASRKESTNAAVKAVRELNKDGKGFEADIAPAGSYFL